MEIIKILEKGEQVSEKQMIDLCGGTDLMANTNKAIVYCSCDGNGDNTNKCQFIRKRKLYSYMEQLERR